jgi:phosphatidylserine decarboxylase
VAAEGFPFLIATACAAIVAWNVAGLLWTTLPAALFVYFFFIFRDPRRIIPAAPLGVFSPVDGVVIDVGVCDSNIVNSEVHRITLRINSLGTYTARSPVEGKIMDFSAALAKNSIDGQARGLWVRTDENDDVALLFRGYRFGMAPRAFLRYGERVGQGQRCAYLRLTRFAEVQLPVNGRVLVSPGQRVSAGSDVIAKLPHH